MLCDKPFVKGWQAYGCGSCVPCRVNQRRVWAHRIELEALDHDQNAFVTLTYRDDAEPEGRTLVKGDLSGFVKRLRSAIAPQRVRFFGVGEYGAKSQRPHYHLALFGFGNCPYGGTRHAQRKSCCEYCDQIRECWGRGFIFNGTLEAHSAGYIAGYVTKKMTSKYDPRLEGRAPEFSVMSRGYAIGSRCGPMFEAANKFMTHTPDLVDVPGAFQYGNRYKPLGRTLKRKLRELCGRAPGCPWEVLQAYESEMQALWLAHKSTSVSLSWALREESETARLALKSRLKFADRRRSL